MKDGIETNMAHGYGGYGYLRSREYGIHDKHFVFCFKIVLHHLSGTVAIPRLLLKILHFVKCVVPVNLRLPGGTTGAPALRSARGTLRPGQRVKSEGFEF